MITESFLNSCFGLIFSQKARDLEESVYPDLLHFLNFVEHRILDGKVGVGMQHKYDLMKNICEHKSKGGSLTEIMVSVGLSEKYNQLMDFISVKESEIVDEKQQASMVATINKLVTFSKLNIFFKKFSEYEGIVRDGNFDMIDDVIAEWKDMVKSASSDVADYELKSRTELVSSFNTRDDGVNSIIDEIRKKYSRENVIPSGIPALDIEILNGGFQPSRVHLFGGTSGVGKSLLLLNCAIRAAMSTPISKNPFHMAGIPQLDRPPERVFLYITMENYVYETWARMYCSMFQKTKEEMLRELFSSKISAETIKEQINSLLAPFNSSIQIEYFPANSISPATISGLISKYNEQPEHRAIKAVYVDYLDLLLPDERREFHRLDLGDITSSLKTISANFEIPLITATQLNREAYKKGKKGDVGSDMISESIQKLFIADFSAMMFQEELTQKNAGDEPDDMPKKVVLKVDKNRDGKTGRAHIYFDYPRSRFMTQEEFTEEYEKLLAI